MPASGWPCAAKCFSVAMTRRLVPERGVALKAAHGGDAHARHQVRIFAVGFLDAAPARIARHIDHRRERLMRAARARFGGGHGEQRLHQFRIEGGAEPDGLRKAGAADGRVAVQAFLVEDHRNAEAAVLDEEFLDGVGQLRHAAGVLALAGIAGAADLAEAVAVFEGRLAFAGSKLPSASTSVSAFCCQTHIICAAFSSSVMRESRSLTRLAARQGRVPIGFGLDGGGHIVVDYNYSGWTSRTEAYSDLPLHAEMFLENQCDGAAQPGHAVFEGGNQIGEDVRRRAPERGFRFR